MQLGNDDPFGAIDDKGAVLGHERDFAHVNFLLLDVLDGLLARLPVVNNQPHLNPQRNRVGDPTQLTFIHIEWRFAEFIGNVFQGGVARVAGDRKDRLKGCMQAFFQPLGRRDLSLQETAVGVHLDGEQIGNFHHPPEIPEFLADALLFGVGVCHSPIPASC